jgi:hypothetical protein
MTPEAKARLIRAYRAACTAADTARAAVDAALTPAALDALRTSPPTDQREAADHLRCLLDTQREADATCAALAAQLRQADARIRTFPSWADHDTPAWRWLLTSMEQEAPLRVLL